MDITPQCTTTPTRGLPVADLGSEEVADRNRDLLDMRFQGEMAGVEEADDRTGHVPRERLGTGRQEERIVLAPDREEGWLVRAEIVLEGGVQRDIALVVADEVQLDLIGTGTGQIESIECITVRRHSSRVGDAADILPQRRLGAQEASERRSRTHRPRSDPARRPW